MSRRRLCEAAILARKRPGCGTGADMAFPNHHYSRTIEGLGNILRRRAVTTGRMIEFHIAARAILGVLFHQVREMMFSVRYQAVSMSFVVGVLILVIGKPPG
jgi:hypothetical protein